MRKCSGREAGMIGIHKIHAEPLTPDSFAAFGQVLGPREQKPLTNRDFIYRGFIRIKDRITADRLADFDILDYWSGIADLVLDAPKLGFLRSRAVPPKLYWLERHLKGTQAYIPLGGQRSILPVAPPKDLEDDDAVPDVNEIRAFLLDGTRGVNLSVGTWHWTPIPLRESADFIMLVRQNAAQEDLNFVDLCVRLNAAVEIILDDPGA